MVKHPKKGYKGMVNIGVTRNKFLKNEESLSSVQYNLLKKFIYNRIDTSNQKIVDFCENNLLEFNFKIHKLLPTDTFNLLVIPIINSCNLNCKSCDAYAPLCSNNVRLYSKKDIIKDVKTLIDLGIHLKEISLEGGEPLLHPEVIDIICGLKEILSSTTHLTLLTNGILLNKLSDEDLLKIKESLCTIVIDKYFESKDLDLAIDRLKTLGVNWELDGCVDSSGWFHRAYITLDESKIKDTTSMQNFISCEKANNIFTLDNSILYICGRSASIKHFNKYFNLDLPDDGINIRNIHTREDLITRLAKPCKLCKHCLPVTDFGYSWEESDKDIKEWVK